MTQKNARPIQSRRTGYGVLFALMFLPAVSLAQQKADSWIRINMLGYAPSSVKVAVLASKATSPSPATFELVDSRSSKVVFKGKTGKDFGAYGPFTHTYRLDFSKHTKPGTYYLRAGNAQSPEFNISAEVYKGGPDFLLQYMRQQRSGYNPFLKDSCHTHDGYTIYGPMPDGTHIDVSGGWHDATDYLQYATTSANATYHLLAAYRDFPGVFGDEHQDNGLEGSNGKADVLDEALWGLRWLEKMHPRPDWMFNQLADDRDHAGFRLPTLDSVDYGWGKGTGRPVYFISGEVQGLFQHKNRATGAASTAGKFASAFALGAQVLKDINASRADVLREKSLSAYALGKAKPGVAQTAPGRARYFYEEDNWVDDMQLGAAALYQLFGEKSYYEDALHYGKQEPVTPWIGTDTARHYQWYPFHNFGHYELAKKAEGEDRQLLISFYRQGIEKVWNKAKSNAFYRGVPFIWCSNNLTTSFAIQCYLYRQLTGDKTYIELEQACFDWIFGLNPWGTSMVYGLPADRDTPTDPHSSYTVLYDYPINGGLVDGPVYTKIFESLLGLELHEADEYAEFQSDLAVYHDDYGDYSTNEPTMDGTASLIYLFAAKDHESREVGGKKK